MENAALRQNPDVSPIRKAELFTSLLESELKSIEAYSGMLQLRKGGRLFSIGERADHFYMLVDGCVRVFRPRPDGGDDEMARFTAGDAIGDFDFARRAEYDACAEALEDSVLIEFPGFGLTLNDMVQDDPVTVSRVLLGSIVMITSRIKSTQAALVENMSWMQELHRRAYEDPGTGLWKQAFLTDEINRILEDPTALIMMKPDRFKVLVDSRGHGAGDEAMVRIAMVMKNITRRVGRGWPLRLKSNEVALLIPKCGAVLAEKISKELAGAVAALDPVPAEGDSPAFHFTGTVSCAVWPEDNGAWESLFQGNYALLLETWKDGGNRIVRYKADA